MTRYDWFAMSESGGRPDGNDDCVLGDPEAGVFVIADGLGGRPGGAQASRAATRALLDALRALPPESRGCDDALRGAVAAANAAVRDVARRDPALEGLGTTLSAVVFAGGRCRVVHVGDSRVCLLRDGAVGQVTMDHTLAAELVARNHLSAEGARRYPLRNVLSRSLGPRETVEPDLETIPLRPGDRLLLATDGVAEVLPPSQLAAAIAGAGADTAEAVCRAVMRAALAAGPRDNVTAAVVRPLDAEAGARASGGSRG
jgi:protein phosphatase